MKSCIRKQQLNKHFYANKLSENFYLKNKIAIVDERSTDSSSIHNNARNIMLCLQLIITHSTLLIAKLVIQNLNSKTNCSETKRVLCDLIRKWWLKVNLKKLTNIHKKIHACILPQFMCTG